MLNVLFKILEVLFKLVVGLVFSVIIFTLGRKYERRENLKKNIQILSNTTTNC